MLYRDLLQAEFSERRGDFVSYARNQRDEISRYEKILRKFSETKHDVLKQRLGGLESTGALPSGETDGSGSFSVPFRTNWSNHEQARAWAGEILADRITFAADGSQLYVEKECSLPVGAIQVGWFENPHNDAKPYTKDAAFRLLTPVELLGEREEAADPETRIGEARFHAEVARVAEFLDRARGWANRGERMPLAFFDGTLLMSLSMPQTSLEKRYVRAMVDLVRRSRETEVPIVGFVDRSLSRDILNLLDAFDGRERTQRPPLPDAVFLDAVSDLTPGWGDRTHFLYSNRHGMGSFRDAQTGKSLVGFCYLSTSAGSAPARLDIPSWIYERGLLDETVNVVRAECVIGLGYPYPLETADSTALITSRDRQIFLKALQEFSVREKLNFSISRKDSSKARRR